MLSTNNDVEMNATHIVPLPTVLRKLPVQIVQATSFSRMFATLTQAQLVAQLHRTIRKPKQSTSSHYRCPIYLSVENVTRISDTTD